MITGLVGRTGLAGLVTVAGLTMTVAEPATHAAAAPATFTARGSVEQVDVTHAVPGDAIELRQGDDVVRSATVDDLGSMLFRDLTPGDGYTVVEHDGSGDQEVGPLHVMSQTETPPQSLYSDQHLNDGFGYIKTRDGTELSVTVHLPGPPDQGPYPTVVEYSGYDPSNPSSPQPSSEIMQLLGYATVGVNIRGTGCSGGAFWYFEPLQSLDGYDVIETVAAQPWVAHGRVGMVGISYPGISQLFVAQTRPPHLAAIAPLSVIADTYHSTLYPGGIFNDGFALSWAQDRVNAAKPYGEGWEQGIVDQGGPNGAQCAENQLLRHENEDLIADIDQHPYYESPQEDLLAPMTFVDKINVPVFMGGAWQDEQTGGQFSVMWNQFTEPSSKLKFFATNGTHVDSLVAEFNRWFEFEEFYVAQRIPQIPPLIRLFGPSLIASQLGIPGITFEPDRFTSYPNYDAALAAYEAEPSVRILLQNGAGDPANPGSPNGTSELDFASWPPPQTVPTTLYFQPDQQLAAQRPTAAATGGRGFTSYVYDPNAKPRTDFSGSSTDIWGPSPAYDWETLPLGKALAFDSPPLTQQTVMAGSGSVDLWLRSTAPDTDLEVTLTELRPDGQELYVQNGWLRASHRALDASKSTVLQPWHSDTQADAAPLPAGQFVEARVALFPFAHVFNAGSRIRITVEAPGGNRPFWTFADLAANGTVTNDIAHSWRYPSKVVLPVIGGATAPTALPPCGSLRGEPCRPTVGSGEPTHVAAGVTNRRVTVVWTAPVLRPGTTLTGYHVVDVQDGNAIDTPAGTTHVTFDQVPRGSHYYAVTAVYATGERVSATSSNAVAVPRRVHHHRHGHSWPIWWPGRAH